MSRRAGAAGPPPRLRRWLTPAAAAAAVLAIAVAVSVVATHAQHARPAHPPHPPPAAQLPGHVPPYYVALHLVPGSQVGAQFRTSAVVTATRTGAELATVNAPNGYFAFAAASAADDDRTFVLAAGLAAAGARPCEGSWRA